MRFSGDESVRNFDRHGEYKVEKYFFSFALIFFFRERLDQDWLSTLARAPFPPRLWISQQFDKESAHDGTRLKTTLFAVLGPVPITQRHARRRLVGEFESRVSQRGEIIRVVGQRRRPQNPIQFGVCRTV